MIKHSRNEAINSISREIAEHVPHSQAYALKRARGREPQVVAFREVRGASYPPIHRVAAELIMERCPELLPVFMGSDKMRREITYRSYLFRGAAVGVWTRIRRQKYVLTVSDDVAVERDLMQLLHVPVSFFDDEAGFDISKAPTTGNAERIIGEAIGLEERRGWRNRRLSTLTPYRMGKPQIYDHELEGSTETTWAITNGYGGADTVLRVFLHNWLEVTYQGVYIHENQIDLGRTIIIPPEIEATWSPYSE